ncbi:RNA polymerase sigma factor [Streptomyces mirabilis]|uniref:RNA polymerase sigma factor n=1 Tax=Streptomyces mirabilis TaxID=68239 RepID=UPI0036DDC784
MATNSGGAGPARPRDRLSREQEAKLSEVLKEVHPRLLTVVMRMTRDYHLAHDVTQETCLAVIQEFRRGTVFRKPVIVYATVVARNKFLSELGRCGHNWNGPRTSSRRAAGRGRTPQLPTTSPRAWNTSNCWLR